MTSLYIFGDSFTTPNFCIKPADWDRGTGWYGHHGAEGNLNWYTKILKPHVTELGWL